MKALRVITVLIITTLVGVGWFLLYDRQYVAAGVVLGFVATGLVLYVWNIVIKEL